MLYVEFMCHIVCVMLTGVGGNAAVGQGYAVRGCHNVCMCLAWVRGWCIGRCMAGCWSVCCR